MDELLQKLLEAEVLSDDTKKELEAAFNVKLDEAIEAAKDDAAADVRADLTDQWIQERDTLVEAIDTKVTEYLEVEFQELKEDIDHFRDLEMEYAEKLVESKAVMSDELKGDLSELVEKIDAFLEIRIESEMEELREDLDEVRKNEFGRKIFEAFSEEFTDGYSDDDSAEVTLRETELRLTDTEQALKESEAQRQELERGLKMDEILSPLAGRQREVMEAILGNVDTQQLDEGYKTFIGRVIRETDASSEKEDKVLADMADDDGDDDTDKPKKFKKFKKSKKGDDCDCDDDDDKDDVKEGYYVSGNRAEMITEGVDDAAAQRLNYLRKLAGINQQ